MTVKEYKNDPIHENVRMFERELKQKFPQLRVTSSFRPRAFTKQGKVSQHAKGGALDLGYDKEIADYLANTYEGLGLLNKYGLGVLDESTKEVMDRTGATGAHLHVGMDSGLVAKAKERYKQFTPKENITPELTDFDYTPQTATFALEDTSVEEEDAPKEEDKSKEVAQAKEILKEEQFLSDLFKGQIAPVQVAQEEAPQQAPQSNLLESFANIESFVDSPLAQQGGVIKDNMGQWKYPGKVTEIASPNITMKGVNYPVLGISKETGEQKLMMPNLDYFFNNTQNVIEYPLKK